jgi:hypothetical protein
MYAGLQHVKVNYMLSVVRCFQVRDSGSESQDSERVVKRVVNVSRTESVVYVDFSLPADVDLSLPAAIVLVYTRHMRWPTLSLIKYVVINAIVETLLNSQFICSALVFKVAFSKS